MDVILGNPVACDWSADGPPGVSSTRSRGLPGGTLEGRVEKSKIIPTLPRVRVQLAPFRPGTESPAPNRPSETLRGVPPLALFPQASWSAEIPHRRACFTEAAAGRSRASISPGRSRRRRVRGGSRPAGDSCPPLRYQPRSRHRRANMPGINPRRSRRRHNSPS